MPNTEEFCSTSDLLTENDSRIASIESLIEAAKKDFLRFSQNYGLSPIRTAVPQLRSENEKGPPNADQMTNDDNNNVTDSVNYDKQSNDKNNTLPDVKMRDKIGPMIDRDSQYSKDDTELYTSARSSRNSFQSENSFKSILSVHYYSVDDCDLKSEGSSAFMENIFKDFEINHHNNLSKFIQDNGINQISSENGYVLDKMTGNWYKTSSPLESEISSPEDVSVNGQHMANYPQLSSSIKNADLNSPQIEPMIITSDGKTPEAYSETIERLYSNITQHYNEKNNPNSTNTLDLINQSKFTNTFTNEKREFNDISHIDNVSIYSSSCAINKTKNNSQTVIPKQYNYLNYSSISNNNSTLDRRYNNLKAVKQLHGNNSQTFDKGPYGSSIKSPTLVSDASDMSASFRYKKNQNFANTIKSPVLTKSQSRLYDQINNNKSPHDPNDGLCPTIDIIDAPHKVAEPGDSYSTKKSYETLYNTSGFDSNLHLPSNRSRSAGRKPLIEYNNYLVKESNENFQLPNKSYKSITSLLETDIDTGLCVEKDMSGNIINQDNYLDKTRSLFNLNSSVENEENVYDVSWLKTKSVQHLIGDNVQHNNEKGSSASGLIARLRSKAKSEHELRVANSLSKLIIPDWLDNANLPEPYVYSNELMKRNELSKSLQRTNKQYDSFLAEKENNVSFTGRDKFQYRSNQLRKSLNLDDLMYEQADKRSKIETVQEPSQINSTTRSQQPRFMRPSQMYLMKHSKTPKLEPIKSKLNHSMRSNIPTDGDIPKRSTLGPMTKTPSTLSRKSLIINGDDRGPTENGIEPELRLGPNDFKLQSDNMYQGNQLTNPFASTSLKASKPGIKPRSSITRNPINHIYPNPPTPSKDQYKIIENKPNETEELRHRFKTNVELVPNNNNNNNNNTTKSSLDLNKKVANGETREKPDGQATIQEIEQYANSESPQQNPKSEDFIDRKSKQDEDDRSSCPSTLPSDGLNRINCLTELTKLIDSSISRNEVLIHENMRYMHQHFYLVTNKSSLHHVTRSMHKVDFDEDAHKKDILNVLSMSQSHEPINLSEFALSQLSGCVERDRYDGKIYISCSHKPCKTRHVKCSENMDWKTCTNCYTIYCSDSCLKSDFEAGLHMEICNFSRAKRLCNLVQKNLNYNQILLLNTLGQNGFEKLGKGAIFLFFSSAKMSEIFIRLSNTTRSKNIKLEQDFIPPVYLTLSEISKLDSTLVKPCKEHSTNKSFLLVTIICAFELNPMSDMSVLPVHLIKQHFVFNITQSLSNAAAEQMSMNDPKLVEAQTYEERKVFVQKTLKRLNHYKISIKKDFPKIYDILLEYIHTGKQFSPLEFVINDPYSEQEYICIIRPMEDVEINELRYPDTRQEQVKGNNLEFFESDKVQRILVTETEL